MSSGSILVLRAFRSRNRSGFTIVELLIVVIVIAILATITIVTYNGITEKAKLASKAQAFSTIVKTAHLFHAEKGAYTLDVASMDTLKAQLSGLVGAATVNTMDSHLEQPATYARYGESGSAYSFVYVALGTQYCTAMLSPDGKKVLVSTSGNGGSGEWGTATIAEPLCGVHPEGQSNVTVCGKWAEVNYRAATAILPNRLTTSNVSNGLTC